MRMKHNKGSWSISGANHMSKILVRFANKTIWNDILHYKNTIIESDWEPVIYQILSAANAPKLRVAFIIIFLQRKIYLNPCV